MVFSPQIFENFRRKSADGLSLLFLVIWLAGDVFNILGAVLQGVLPTMIILAVYYTLADIVLLFQCLYYRGFSLSDEPQKPRRDESSLSQNCEEGEQGTENVSGSSEQTPLMVSEPHEELHLHAPQHRPHHGGRHLSHASVQSLREHLSHLDSTHLSPAMPLLEPKKPSTRDVAKPASSVQIVAFNSFTVALVCAAGVLGWYISVRSTPQARRKQHLPKPDTLEFDVLGQVFGYLCAVLYLGSRIPQLLLNWRRRSTEGVSLLFFLFACIGNLTYVTSIFAYSPICADNGGVCEPGEQKQIYSRYILVNLSWLLGSLGTLFLDMAIFAQFIMYRQKNNEVEDEGIDNEE